MWLKKQVKGVTFFQIYTTIRYLYVSNSPRFLWEEVVIATQTPDWSQRVQVQMCFSSFSTHLRHFLSVCPILRVLAAKINLFSLIDQSCVSYRKYLCLQLLMPKVVGFGMTGLQFGQNALPWILLKTISWNASFEISSFSSIVRSMSISFVTSAIISTQSPLNGLSSWALMNCFFREWSGHPHLRCNVWSSAFSTWEWTLWEYFHSLSREPQWECWCELRIGFHRHLPTQL